MWTSRLWRCIIDSYKERWLLDKLQRKSRDVDAPRRNFPLQLVKIFYGTSHVIWFEAWPCITRLIINQGCAAKVLVEQSCINRNKKRELSRHWHVESHSYGLPPISWVKGTQSKYHIDSLLVLTGSRYAFLEAYTSTSIPRATPLWAWLGHKVRLKAWLAYYMPMGSHTEEVVTGWKNFAPNMEPSWVRHKPGMDRDSRSDPSC
jgi:hypothetical protein